MNNKIKSKPEKKKLDELKAKKEEEKKEEEAVAEQTELQVLKEIKELLEKKDQ